MKEIKRRKELNMDNNTGNRPVKRKKVTRQVIRRRQMGALAVITFLILMFFLLIFKGCSNDNDKKKDKNQPAVTTTSTIATTTAPITTVTTTTTHPLASQVFLSKREMFINVGGTDISYITGYPTGSSEANEVWKSMDESIATVDSLGHVVGVGQGETFIILSFDNNPSIEIEIKVHVAAGIGDAVVTTTVPVTPITPVVPGAATTTNDLITSFATTPVAALDENVFTA